MKKLVLALALVCLPMQAQQPAPAFKNGAMQVQQHWTGTANGWYPWSAEDKLCHFELGFGGGVMTYSVFHDIFKLKHSWLWTLLTGLVVGYGKEIYDRHHFGTPEHADALNTAAGFALGGFSVKIVLSPPHTRPLP